MYASSSKLNSTVAVSSGLLFLVDKIRLKLMQKDKKGRWTKNLKEKMREV